MSTFYIQLIFYLIFCCSNFFLFYFFSKTKTKNQKNLKLISTHTYWVKMVYHMEDGSKSFLCFLDHNLPSFPISFKDIEKSLSFEKSMFQ
jgi:hypothetical protein